MWNKGTSSRGRDEGEQRLKVGGWGVEGGLGWRGPRWRVGGRWSRVRPQERGWGRAELGSLVEVRGEKNTNILESRVPPGK